MEVTYRKLEISERDTEELRRLTSTSLVATALASGDANSVREVLRKKNLEKPVERAFRVMQIAQGA